MLRLLLVVFVLGSAAGVAGYYYVDRKVVGRLNSRDSGVIPAIYSDALAITPRSRLDPQTLRQILSQRRYRETSSAPSNQGEFHEQEGVFEIFTRDYRSADGGSVSAQKVRYVPAKHEISDLQDQSHQAFVLEPDIVSYLGSTDRRASKYKTLKEIPPILSKAVIAIEDERFATHHGIDLIGISRAMAKNVMAMRIVEGGSTLTQQLAKNLLFTPERTIGRKVMEALAALSLEFRLSKQRILEMYLNEVYLGQEGSVALHGVAEAARAFFAKDLSELSLRECCMLAGLIKAPSYFSPRKHYKRLIERSQLVLNKMHELDLVKAADYERASLERPKVVANFLHERNAAHYVLALSEELEKQFNLEAAALAGVSVYTGIELGMQRCAESALREGLLSLEKKNPRLRRQKDALEAGLVAIEPHSGKIRAWVGSRSYAKSQFDHVSQAQRQVGSTIKPFLYLTALDAHLNDYRPATTMTVLSDEPMQVDLVTRKTWVPENYDRDFRGDVTLRYALENSLNIPAAYVGQRVGIAHVANTIRNFRVSDNPPEVPALALGALDTSLLRLTAGYAGLANGGIYTAPRLFVSALDQDGGVLTSSRVFEDKIADENAVYVLTNVLQGVIERGTGRAIRTGGFTGQAAGKTGTTNETRDAWFVGFTPTLATGVWVGYDDNSKIGLTGGVAAAPIWAEFMKCAAPYYDEENFLPPPGVVFVAVDRESGELASPSCPSENVVKEVYVRGTEPTRSCHVHSDYPEDLPPSDASQPGSDQGWREDKEKRRERRIWEVLFG